MVNILNLLPLDGAFLKRGVVSKGLVEEQLSIVKIEGMKIVNE